MNKNELLYALALQHVAKIGDITAKEINYALWFCRSCFKRKKAKHLLKIRWYWNCTVISDLYKRNHIKAAEKNCIYINNENMCLPLFYRRRLS